MSVFIKLNCILFHDRSRIQRTYIRLIALIFGRAWLRNYLSLKYFSGKSGEKSHEQSKKNEENKKKYELKRKREFQSAWHSKFSALEDIDTGIVCTVCKKQFSDSSTGAVSWFWEYGNRVALF